MRTALSIPFVISLFAAAAAAQQLGAVDSGFDGLNLLDKITAIKEPAALDFEKRDNTVWVPVVQGLRKHRPKKSASASASASAAVVSPQTQLKVVNTQVDLDQINGAAPAVAAAVVNVQPAVASVDTPAAVVVDSTAASAPIVAPVVAVVAAAGTTTYPAPVLPATSTPTYTPDSLDALRSRLAAKVSLLQASPNANQVTVTLASDANVSKRDHKLHDDDAAPEFPHLKRQWFKANGDGSLQNGQAKAKSAKIIKNKVVAAASSTAAAQVIVADVGADAYVAPTVEVLIATNALGAVNVPLASSAAAAANAFNTNNVNVLLAAGASSNIDAGKQDLPPPTLAATATFAGLGNSRPSFVANFPGRMAKVNKRKGDEEA